MSKNKYKAQVWVLPEDDANREIAQGFTLDPAVRDRNIHILPVAKGWPAVRDAFEHEYNGKLLQFTSCAMVLLVDFDGRGAERRENVLSGVDAALRDRVFVLGARDEPEGLKAALGISFEQIGKALAKECHEKTRTVWQHDLLSHNRDELDRMTPSVWPILFG